MVTTDNKKTNLSESLKELSDITTWFDKQENVDVESALEKVQRAADIIKLCNKKLSDVENKFEEIQRDLDAELNPEVASEVNF